MAAPETFQVIDVVGAAAAAIPIDSTGNNYDGDFRFGWPFGVPSPYTSARFEAGGDFSATDAQVDFHLRNFTDGSNIASMTNLTSEPNRAVASFDPTDIDSGDEIGVRVNVDTASATGGATLDLGALVVLRP